MDSRPLIFQTPEPSTPKETKKRTNSNRFPENQWIGLRENLQETIDFPMKYGAFL
jgi:hypothetical protein